MKGVGFGETSVNSGSTACLQKPCHLLGPRFLSDMPEIITIPHAVSIQCHRGQQLVIGGADKVSWWPPRACTATTLFPVGKPCKLTAVSIPNTSWLSHRGCICLHHMPRTYVGSVESRPESEKGEKDPGSCLLWVGRRRHRMSRAEGWICAMTPWRGSLASSCRRRGCDLSKAMEPELYSESVLSDPTAQAALPTIPHSSCPNTFFSGFSGNPRHSR